MTYKFIDRTEYSKVRFDADHAAETAADLARNLEWFINAFGSSLLKSELARGSWDDECMSDRECSCKYHPLSHLAESYQAAQALLAFCNRLREFAEKAAPPDE